MGIFKNFRFRDRFPVPVPRRVLRRSEPRELQQSLRRCRSLRQHYQCSRPAIKVLFENTRPAPHRASGAAVVTGFLLLLAQLQLLRGKAPREIGSLAIETRAGGPFLLGLQLHSSRRKAKWASGPGRVLLRRSNAPPSPGCARPLARFVSTRTATAIDTPDLFAPFRTLMAQLRRRQALFSAASAPSNIPLVVANRRPGAYARGSLQERVSMESAARNVHGAASGRRGDLFAGPRARSRCTAPLRPCFIFARCACCASALRDENDRAPPRASTSPAPMALRTRPSSARVVAMSAEYYFHAHDAFEIEMPAGEDPIEAARGPSLGSERLILTPGKPTEALVATRALELRRARLLVGRRHIHANYTAPGRVIGPNDVRLQVNKVNTPTDGAATHHIFEGRAEHRSVRPVTSSLWNRKPQQRLRAHVFHGAASPGGTLLQRFP